MPMPVSVLMPCSQMLQKKGNVWTVQSIVERGKRLVKETTAAGGISSILETCPNDVELVDCSPSLHMTKSNKRQQLVCSTTRFADLEDLGKRVIQSYRTRFQNQSDQSHQ